MKSAALHKKRRQYPCDSRGFALVVTISLLVLLTLVGIGMLSLSALSLRTSSRAVALAEARCNARFALLLAIADLQKQAGADQRITANAAILDDSPESPEIDGVAHPHWTGVWDSWAAGAQAFGDDRASEHRTIVDGGKLGMAPSYQPAREDHFRGWLVSLTGDRAGDIDSARSLALEAVPMPDAGSEGVQLVGAGTLGEDAPSDGYVAAGLVEVVNPELPGRNRFAWWVADESTKARVMADSYELGDALEKAELIERVQSAGASGHDTIDALADLDDAETVERIISRHTIELAAADRKAASGVFHDVTPYSSGVMADVREGGLKRDLSTLLERPIDIDEDDDEFMLYRLGGDDARVPIQDLAAYYQCYRDVVDYTGQQAQNRFARNTLQVNNIDFREGYNFLRDYTNLYRMPIPVKIQFLLSYEGVRRDKIDEKVNPDKYKLHIGMTPAVTLWNPYDLPLVLNFGADQSTQLRMFNIPFGISWRKTGARGTFSSPKPNSLVWLTNRNAEDWSVKDGIDTARNSDRDNGLTMYVGGVRNHVIFQPGEVRVFSLRRMQKGRGGYEGIVNSNRYSQSREADPGWDPTFFLKLPRSEKSNNAAHVEREYPNADSGRLRDGGALTFDADDTIGITITAAEAENMANGAALHFFHRQSSTMYPNLDRGEDKAHMRRQFQFTSRLHKDKEYKNDNSFNEQLMRRSFPNDKGLVEVPGIKGRELVGRHRPFLLVSLTAGCEVSQETSGDFRGRRFVSRPFLHSTPVQSCVWVDRADFDSFYHHGWNWWVQDINSVLEASVQVAGNNRSSFWGGGYTPDYGSTNIVQQEVPLTPVHSIAALSSAQLSGYSIANEILGYGAGGRVDNFEGTTATGANGLFPRTSQAIGNSYAHPYLPADAAYGTWTHHYNVTEGEETKPFADHSYLANKALWDDYFFSSISPRLTKVFDGTRTGDARKVAERFFFEGEKLPNRRFTPYREGMSEAELGRYFDGDTANLAGADEFAARLMVEGPFNVNSTSVEAWRAVFSGLRDREVPYLETNGNGNRLGREVPIERKAAEGVPVAGVTLGSGEPFEGSSTDPSDARQWHCWRQLTDEEIGQLAVAMVEQVKLRGPFLSLSEFVNRRLDGDDKELAVKGALQAAIDDENVDINAGFRHASRRFSDAELGTMKPKFPEALAGPVAYGSAAYVDQADILRGLGGQLTPRGDTFLIRGYGDSLAPDGTVRARAWCEAVVQRVPEYVDREADAAHVSFDELSSDANREFGRPFRMVAFRWLSAEEI